MTERTVHSAHDAEPWFAADEDRLQTGWRRYRDVVLAFVVGLLIVGAGVWDILANGPIHPHV